MRSSAAVLGLFIAVAVALPVHDDRRRGMSSWSGWMPGSGMTMFTSGVDDPWGMQPPPIWRMDDEGLARPMESEGPHQPPTHAQQPRKRGHEDEEEEEEDTRTGEAIDHKEETNSEMGQYEVPPEKGDSKSSISFYLPSSENREEKKMEIEVKGSKANASFNAWFPIVLGYPGSEEARSRGEWRGADERGVAAVANSVNHGRSGVASSHAVIYSGEPPSRRRSAPEVTRPTN